MVKKWVGVTHKTADDNQMFLALFIYFSLVAVLSVFNNGRLIKGLVGAGLFVGVLLDGLRIDTGTDWLPYHDHYDNLFMGYPEGYGNFEIGYQYFAYVLKNICDNYTFFLLVHAAVVYYFVYYAIFRLSKFQPIAVALLYGSLYAMLGSNRQLLALAFLVFSIEYIIERRFVAFALVIICGALFHRTILVFLPFYFFYGLTWRRYLMVFMVLLVVVFLIGFNYSNILGFIDGFSPFDLVHYYAYFGGDVDDTRPVLAVSKKLVALCIPLLFVRKSSFAVTNDITNFLLFSMFCASISMLMYILGEFGLAALNSRLDMYFGYIFYSIFASLTLSRISNKVSKLALVVFMLSLAFVTFFQNPMYDLFEPYKSIFLNTEYVRKLY